MPATTAEKRARQRANKLLRIGAETTTVSDVQLPAATDKITSEPLTPPVLPCSYYKLNFLTSNVSSRQLGQVRKASILRYSGDVHLPKERRPDKKKSIIEDMQLDTMKATPMHAKRTTKLD